MSDTNTQETMRKRAKELLETKQVDVVIGFAADACGRVAPAFVTDPSDTGRLLWNEECTKTNLAGYLLRAETKKLGKPALIASPASRRSINVLIAESQLTADSLVLIDMEPDTPEPPAASRYEKLQFLKTMSRDERLAYWKQELARCIKCYACRQVCPLCYCQVCIVDKNRPQRLDTSATLKGNFAWNITRAFHLAGRCVNCGACSDACPAGIDFSLLNLSLAEAAEKQFDGYRAGTTPETLPIIGTFNTEDQEAFIR